MLVTSSLSLNCTATYVHFNIPHPSAITFKPLKKKTPLSSSNTPLYFHHIILIRSPFFFSFVFSGLQLGSKLHQCPSPNCHFHLLITSSLPLPRFRGYPNTLRTDCWRNSSMPQNLGSITRQVASGLPLSNAMSIWALRVKFSIKRICKGDSRLCWARGKKVVSNSE